MAIAGLCCFVSELSTSTSLTSARQSALLPTFFGRITPPTSHHVLSQDRVLDTPSSCSWYQEPSSRCLCAKPTIMPGLLNTDSAGAERLYAAIAAGEELPGWHFRVRVAVPLSARVSPVNHWHWPTSSAVPCCLPYTLLCCTEFFCTALFAFFGGAAPGASAAAANGVALAVLGACGVPQPQFNCCIQHRTPCIRFSSLSTTIGLSALLTLLGFFPAPSLLLPSHTLLPSSYHHLSVRVGQCVWRAPEPCSHCEHTHHWPHQPQQVRSTWFDWGLWCGKWSGESG